MPHSDDHAPLFRMQDFQKLADEAFRDMLEKHGRRRDRTVS
jgi:hypothetical protein